MQITKPIIGQLTGDDCATALGRRVHSATPVLDLCRQLIADGHDPAAQLHAYRAGTLALTVRSIGQAAQLEINGHGNGFRWGCGGGAASPMRSHPKNDPQYPDDKTASLARGAP